MRYVRIESGFALLIALGINILVISVMAAAFFGELAEDSVGLGNAGALLAEQYGAAMRYIWGVGLLAAALASTVTSTYSGQVVMTGFLRVRVSVFWRITLVRLSTLGPTLLVAVLLGSSDASFSSLTEWLNIVQSLVLPFVIIPLLAFTSSAAVMGPHANRPWAVGALSLVVAFLIGMNAYLAVSFGLEQVPVVAWARALFGLACALYCAFLLYLLAGPARVGRWASAAKASVLKARASMPAMPVGRAVDMMDGM
jgi:natural resistance-associated macrophage protein